MLRLLVNFYFFFSLSGFAVNDNNISGPDYQTDQDSNLRIIEFRQNSTGSGTGQDSFMATELYFDIFAVCGPLRENKKVDTFLYLHTSELNLW